MVWGELMPEEDLSIEEILKSIRHILSEEKEEDVTLLGAGEPIVGNPPVHTTNHKTPATDVFVLTEAMRVPETPLFTREELKGQHRPFIRQTPVSSKVSQDPVLGTDKMEENLIPLIQKWLDGHLPAIVERVVEREIKALLKR